MTNSSSSLRRLSRRIVVGLLGLVALASTATAANVRMEVYAKGRWALIVPGSNLGGRVVWSSAHGCYITDRAQRGEYLWITKSPSTAAEYNCPWAYWSDLHSKANGRSVALSSGWMTLYDYTQTPTGVSWDNNHIRICTVSGYYEQRLPVGSR